MAGLLNAAVGLVTTVGFAVEFLQHWRSSLHLLAYLDAFGVIFGVCLIGFGTLLLAGHQTSRLIAGVAALTAWPALGLVLVPVIRYGDGITLVWAMALAGVAVASTLAWRSGRCPA